MSPSVLSALVWSALGFGLGWMSCRIAMKTAIAEAKRSGIFSQRRVTFEVIRALIGVLLLIMVAITGIQYYRTTSCQTAYNQQVAQALALRVEASRVETVTQIQKAEAQKTFLLSVVQQGSSSEDIIAEYVRTLDDNIAALRELEEARVANPIPAAPDCRRFG